MIDYMPIEVMAINEFNDDSIYNLNSMLFWHIGAS
jgi:hypothetical protein